MRWERSVFVGASSRVELWLSTTAVEAFVNAKETGTNASLYPRGLDGPIGAMRPIWLPALDGTAVDALIGPTDTFCWAEETFTLQIDAPAKAGRDVALVGVLWLAPLYPSLFTKFALP